MEGHKRDGLVDYIFAFNRLGVEDVSDGYYVHVLHLYVYSSLPSNLQDQHLFENSNHI